jgi:Na+(H+)/acetate symporter ActP
LGATSQYEPHTRKIAPRVPKVLAGIAEAGYLRLFLCSATGLLTAQAFIVRRLFTAQVFRSRPSGAHVALSTLMASRLLVVVFGVVLGVLGVLGVLCAIFGMWHEQIIRAGGDRKCPQLNKILFGSGLQGLRLE